MAYKNLTNIYWNFHEHDSLTRILLADLPFYSVNYNCFLTACACVLYLIRHFYTFAFFTVILPILVRHHPFANCYGIDLKFYDVKKTEDKRIRLWLRCL